MIERALVAAYPPPVRRRWGADLAAEINSSSLAGRLNSLTGAARLWLRPAQWPASTGSHLRRAVVVLALVTTAITGLGVRTSSPTAAANHGLTAIGLATLVIGLATLIPLPQSTSASVRAITRALAAPACLASAMLAATYLLAQLTTQATGALRVAEIAFYWLTLGTAVSTPAIALCRVDPDHLHVPGTTRATIGLATVATGHAISGSSGLILATTPLTVALATVQIALTAITLLAVIDLRRNRLT